MADQYDDGRYDPGFGYGLPITAVRGGIKYPTPTKETHMPERMTKSQIEHELRVNDELIKQLRVRRQDLQRQAATAIPAEPPSNCTMFSVDVQFKFRGKRYQFLVLRSGSKYFTTGSGPEHKKFENWAALCAWLEGPDVYTHSDLEVLKSGGTAVSFESGGLVTLSPDPVPF